MGHDIYGFRLRDEVTYNDHFDIDEEYKNGTLNEVAYLRRGAFDEKNSIVYKALNVQEYSSGVSGYGESCIFDYDDLNWAIKYITTLNDETLSREIEFLNDCIKNLNENRLICIYFG